MKIVEHPFLDMRGEYFWCLHCECVNPAEEWEKNDFGCPEKDCDGGAMDIHIWGPGFLGHKDYPAKPVIGKKYPMYPLSPE